MATNKALEGWYWKVSWHSDPLKSCHQRFYICDRNNMPINYKDYDPNWKTISKGKIESAGDRCELCYAPNAHLVVRDKSQKHPWDLVDDYDPQLLDDGEGNGGFNITKIVLTVHHIDGDKKNNNDMNLIALCQRCHLRLDLQKHVRNRMKNKDINQVSLF